MKGSRRTSGAARTCLVLAGLVSLGACASIGAELAPGRRAVAQGWMVSLHDAGAGQYQVVVQHPPGQFTPAAAVQARLEGDKEQPRTWSVSHGEITTSSNGAYSVTMDKQGGTIEPVATQVVTDRTEVARTAWTFDRARWTTGRPFRLVLTPALGMDEPPVVLVVVLGPKPGNSEGLELHVVPGT
jgi:hypothetical protein